MTLHCEGLACRRGRREVLAGVSLSLAAGEVLGVLGANGAGKTTLLSTLAGEIDAAGGTLRFGERGLADLSAAALARRRAVLPQSPSLAFDLDVHTVVGMGAYPFPELSPAGLEALVEQALALADAAEFAGRQYATLSGGEQQRVQFARVVVQLLAAKPAGEYRVLFLDEPIASLDPRHQVALLRAVSRLTREHGTAAFVVLHDVNLAAAWCDRLLLLADGHQVALDTPARVLTEEQMERVYQLPARVLDHPERPGLPWVLFRSAAGIDRSY
ncbi:MAG: heme ABC transporter ATP-binding protein [Burkholderiales bacterium]|nr:heme ABC transporter ATP-binding protein [Burkholderiales bacterium]